MQRKYILFQMPIDVIQNSILVSDTYRLKQSLILRLLSCIEAQ